MIVLNIIYAVPISWWFANFDINKTYGMSKIQADYDCPFLIY